MNYMQAIFTPAFADDSLFIKNIHIKTVYIKLFTLKEPGILLPGSGYVYF